MTIVSTGYDGTVQEGPWAMLARFLGRTYAVGTPADFQVTTVSGLDRTIRLAPGQAYGFGVLDQSDAYETLTLDAPATGSRWDTIVLNRNWQSPEPGKTTPMVRTGGSIKALSASIVHDPGTEDDQVIALVQVTAGQQYPTAIADYRIPVTEDRLSRLVIGGSDTEGQGLARIEPTGELYAQRIATTTGHTRIEPDGRFITENSASISGNLDLGGILITPQVHAGQHYMGAAGNTDVPAMSADGYTSVNFTNPAASLWCTIKAAGFSQQSVRDSKQDIVPTGYGLSDVMALRPVDFAYKVTPGRAETGFIAEDVAEVYPVAVTWDEDGELFGIDYGKLTPLLVAAVQELTTRLEELERKVGQS